MPKGFREWTPRDGECSIKLSEEKYWSVGGMLNKVVPVTSSYEILKGVNDLQIYLGFKEGKRPETIESDTQPTKESHSQYDFFYGPFKTFKEASAYVKAMTGLACGDGEQPE